MNEEAKTLVPKLRFFEFVDTEMWQVKQFGNLDLDVSDGNYSSKYPSQSDFTKTGVPFLRANNLKFGTVIDEDMRFISAKQHSEITKGHLKKGDILLTTRGELGTMALVPERHIGSNINAQLVRVNTANKLINTFLFQLLDYSRILGHFEALSTGTALKQLPIGKLNQLSLAIPVTLAEQQKIADCLSSLDDLITAQKQKVKALKQHKKGLMQQLFPAEGETVPKLRFPEFRNKLGWDEKQLKHACDMQAGKFVQASEIKSTSSDDLYPCYGGNGLRGYTKTYTHEGTYSLIGRQGALCGNINLVSGQFHATEHALVTIPKDGVDTNWLFYKLELLNLNQYATGQAQPGLSVENLERVEIKIPRDLVEQQEIAKCLSALDKLINEEFIKVDLLKKHKKSLMQQLFPIIE